MPVKRGPSKKAFLDEIRLIHGPAKLKRTFHQLTQSQIGKAIGMINDTSVSFPTLFLLQSEMRKADLLNSLIPEYKNAMEIADRILLRRESEDSKVINDENKEAAYPILKWILATGYMEDGLNDQYDEVIETAAILLAKVYQDEYSIDIMEDMIFSRHRKGFYIYDLVWAYFETCGYHGIEKIINRLKTPNQKDVELAVKLLNFIPCIRMELEKEPYKLHKCALKWFKQNWDFLYFTGESFLQSSNPCRYTVSLGAKYLHKRISINGTDIPGVLNEAESKVMEVFNQQNEDVKELLSDCSFDLYRKNKRFWNIWVKYPIDKQIELARRQRGHIS